MASSKVPPHRTPGAAPIPPTSTGSHPVDSQGVRRYDAEEAHLRGPAPTPVPRPFFSKPGMLTTPAQIPIITDHRIICASLPPFPIRHGSPNVFIPCFAMMYNILAVMNDKVCSLRPFSDQGPVNNWIPHASVLVYSILAFVQTFRAQRLLQALSADQSRFLDAFISRFPLENIVIPGPLVPFFRSLSISNPNAGDFQNVGPSIPELTFNEEFAYVPIFVPPNMDQPFSGIISMIPNIPLMIDQFRNLMEHLLQVEANGQRRKYSTYVQLSTIFGLSDIDEDDDFHTVFELLRTSVGFQHRPSAADGLMTRFADFYSGAIPSFPAAWSVDQDHAPVEGDPDADPPIPDVPASWFEFEFVNSMFGFNDSVAWFHTLLMGMPTFTQHFKGNQRLLDISPMSSTAAMVRFHGVTHVDIPRSTYFIQHSLNNATRRLTFNTYAATSCSTLPSEDVEDAQMAQLNISSSTVFNDGLRIGDLNVTHFGDYWQYLPEVMRSSTGDLTSQFQAIACSPDYFQESP